MVVSKQLIIIVVMIGIGMTLFADEYVKTEEGKTVLLKHNGTWEYVDSIVQENRIKAFSIRQLVEDNIQRAGTHVTLFGKVVGLKLEYENPIDSKKKINGFSLQDEGYVADLVFYNYLDLNLIKNNDMIAITAPIIMINKSNKSIMCGGYGFELEEGNNLYLNGFTSIEWTLGDEEEIPDEITVDNYYSRGLNFNDKVVTLYGKISEISRSNYFFGSTMIVLSSENGTINCHYPDIELDNSIKEVLRNLSPDQDISFLGTFYEEYGFFTSFKISRIIESK